MYAISICNLQHLVEIDHPRIEQVVRDVLHSERAAAADVSVAVVDDARIQQLNRMHLGHDYPTDVLSFLLECRPDPESLDDQTPPARLGSGKHLEGEVIVSAETAAREADRFGWSPADELLLYVVHGTLHLCGYVDSREAERKRMRRREADILQIRGLTPHYELTAR